MTIKDIGLHGAYYIEPKLFNDNRGFFFEWFNQKKFEKETGVKFESVQFNYSKSSRGVIRGLHFQQYPKAQQASASSPPAWDKGQVLPKHIGACSSQGRGSGVQEHQGSRGDHCTIPGMGKECGTSWFRC